MFFFELAKAKETFFFTTAEKSSYSLVHYKKKY